MAFAVALAVVLAVMLFVVADDTVGGSVVATTSPSEPFVVAGAIVKVGTAGDNGSVALDPFAAWCGAISCCSASVIC